MPKPNDSEPTVCLQLLDGGPFDGLVIPWIVETDPPYTITFGVDRGKEAGGTIELEDVIPHTYKAFDYYAHGPNLEDGFPQHGVQTYAYQRATNNP